MGFNILFESAQGYTYAQLGCNVDHTNNPVVFAECFLIFFVDGNDNYWAPNWQNFFTFPCEFQ